MALSVQQEAVINWAENGKGSLNLVARAGCGKTTTLLALTSWISENRPKQEVFLGAFNKSIASEISAKLVASGVNAKASTMHSAGFAAWRTMAPKVKVVFDKTSQILKQVEVECRNLATGDRFAMMTEKADMCVRYGNFIRKAVSLAKQRAFGFLNNLEDMSQWYAMIDHFGLEDSLEEEEFVDMEHIIKLCIAVYKRGVALDHEMIDFDDMIAAPLIHKSRCKQYPWVFIDEAQDTNPARRALAMKMLKPKGRMVVVGDPNQAIYGFTGADNDSMDQIKTAMGSSELPLNLTYRCPKSVVALAQTWVPDIEAHSTNIEGVVRDLSLTKTGDEPTFWDETFTADDAILCRNTKPLVQTAYSLLRKGVACRVEGRDIGNGLINLIRKWKQVVNLTTLTDRVESWKERETQKWQAKGKDAMAAAVEDKADTILCIIEMLLEQNKTKVEDLISWIKEMFNDTPDGEKAKTLTLCTAHRAKGREWQKVYWLRPDLSPSKWARSEWQMEQEKNLMYVIVTRTQVELVRVHP